MEWLSYSLISETGQPLYTRVKIPVPKLGRCSEVILHITRVAGLEGFHCVFITSVGLTCPIIITNDI